MYNFLRFSIIVDGETHYVPSDQMLREVLPTLPNMAEQEALCLDSNYFVLSLSFDPPDEVVEKELEIWENCCKNADFEGIPCDDSWKIDIPTIKKLLDAHESEQAKLLERIS